MDLYTGQRQDNIAPTERYCHIAQGLDADIDVEGMCLAHGDDAWCLQVLVLGSGSYQLAVLGNLPPVCLTLALFDLDLLRIDAGSL